MPAQPTLVRYWKDGYAPDPVTAFVDWVQNGPRAEFIVACGHELAPAIEDVSDSPCLLTVYSTNELEWQIHHAEMGSFEIDGIWQYGVRFVCNERRQQLRDALLSDDYLIEMWLEAEKRWHDKAA